MTHAAPDRFEGTYFDGRDGRAQRVTLRRVGAAHFMLEGEGLRRGGALAHVTLTPRLARIARSLEFADGARLQLAADAPIDAWFPRRERLEAVVDRLERAAHAVAAAMVIALATIVGGVVWGIPWAADRIAERLPPAVEQSLGEQVLTQLDRFGFKASALDPQRRAELESRFDSLRRGLPASERYRLEFRDAPGVGANAFALPGGTLVVTDQLVRALGDDREFDAVLAHEIGHEQQHHVLRQTLRGSFVAIVAALFAGDVSSASVVVAAVPTFLLSGHYSREFESQADAFAFDLLARRAESPHWFARAMERLFRAHPDAGHIAYLSSHPATADRIQAAESAAHAFAAAHPEEICANGVCPGDADADRNEQDCEDCDKDGSGTKPEPTCPAPAEDNDEDEGEPEHAPVVTGAEPERAFAAAAARLRGAAAWTRLYLSRAPARTPARA